MLKTFPVILFLAGLTAFAQQVNIPSDGCQSKFAVIYHDERLPQPYMVRLSKQQSAWWSASGQKKYKTFCMDNDEADYLVVWAAPVEGVEPKGNGGLAPVSRSFVYVTRLPKRTPVEDVLIHGKPEGEVIYEKEVLPGTPWHGFGAQYSKDLSLSVLEDALKNIVKVSP